MPDIAAPDGMEHKFNPYHDPDDGRFTFAPGGRASARPAGAGWNLAPRDGARPDLRSIERHFQVQEDRMTVWPKLGSYNVSGVEPRPVTVTEARMLNNLVLAQGLVGLLEFNSIAKRAMATAATAYPAATQIPPAVEAQIQRMPAAKADEARQGWPTNDGHRDACATPTGAQLWHSATARTGPLGSRPRMRPCRTTRGCAKRWTCTTTVSAAGLRGAFPTPLLNS